MFAYLGSHANSIIVTINLIVSYSQIAVMAITSNRSSKYRHICNLDAYFDYYKALGRFVKDVGFHDYLQPK